MSLSDRDRKIVLAIVPILLLVGYWFLLLAPKRDEAAKAGKDLTEQTQRRDAARTAAAAARGAKTDFAADYSEIVRLGKAIPAGVDMPSLVVQLDRAAAGTDIRFTRIAMGERDTTATAAPAAATPPPANGAAPVEAGGAPAQSAPGSAAESANNTAQTASNQADAASQQTDGASQQANAASQSGVDATTSTSTGNGGLPIGGGATNPAAPAAGSTGPTGLETVPLELQFVGNFFNLADFFHDVKRFVRVANQNVVVSGRLVTIEDVKFESDPELFPQITAELEATVYLSPKAQGTTAGATPQGPAPVPGTETTPASTQDGTNPSPTPTATATP